VSTNVASNTLMTIFDLALRGKSILCKVFVQSTVRDATVVRLKARPEANVSHIRLIALLIQNRSSKVFLLAL
jgi:hypothetical protein